MLKWLLTTTDANSRLVYLMTNITVCLCIIALTVAAICKGYSNYSVVIDAYIYLVGVLLAGGVSGAAGRWLTGRKQGPPPPESSSETTTTTVEKKVN